MFLVSKGCFLAEGASAGLFWSSFFCNFDMFWASPEVWPKHRSSQRWMREQGTFPGFHESPLLSDSSLKGFLVCAAWACSLWQGLGESSALVQIYVTIQWKLMGQDQVPSPSKTKPCTHTGSAKCCYTLFLVSGETSNLFATWNHLVGKGEVDIAIPLGASLPLLLLSSWLHPGPTSDHQHLPSFTWGLPLSWMLLCLCEGGLDVPGHCHSGSSSQTTLSIPLLPHPGVGELRGVFHIPSWVNNPGRLNPANSSGNWLLTCHP